MQSDLMILANGISMSYNDSNTKELNLIFIHGFPFDKSSWQPQFNFFKKQVRVISYDIRGFGKSTADIKKSSINLFADDLIALMDALKIEQAIVCGLSMGGYILLNALERYPKRFKGAILCDTQCIADSQEGKQKRFDTIKEIEKNGLEEFSTSFLKNAFSINAQVVNPQLVSQIKKIITSTSPTAVTSALDALAGRKDTCAGLQNISVPTLILCGQEDVLTPVKQSEFLESQIKNSELKIIENSGHLSNLEQANLFNESIEQFLNKNFDLPKNI